VAAYSGEGALKGGNAKQSYNDRVIGCRLAARLLAQRLRTRSTQVLGSLMGSAGLAAAAATLPDQASPQEISEALHTDLEPLIKMSAGEFPADRIIPVRAPALHVFGEASRVEDMEIALLEGDLTHIGALLDQSHTSLATLFGCSTPALDQLCKDMRRAGALGARLTGAGFGGYAIAAATPDTIDDVLEAAMARTGGPAFEVIPGPGLGRISRSGTLQAAA
jgi:galactokinase